MVQSSPLVWSTDIRSARLYCQFSLDKTLTLQAGSTVLKIMSLWESPLHCCSVWRWLHFCKLLWTADSGIADHGGSPGDCKFGMAWVCLPLPCVWSTYNLRNYANVWKVKKISFTRQVPRYRRCTKMSRWRAQWLEPGRARKSCQVPKG